jgi:hypothetical protein
METAARATTNWRSSYGSPFPYFLAAGSYAPRPSHSNRNKNSFKNARNPLNPNEKAFSNRNSKSLFPIHSALRLNWRGTVESENSLKSSREATNEKFGDG